MISTRVVYHPTMQLASRVCSINFQEKLIELISISNRVREIGRETTTMYSVAHLVSVFSGMFFFQLMRKARIGLVCLINDAKNPRRHKILRPHRKHSPKSTVKFQRPSISKQIIFDRRDCLCLFVRVCSDGFMRAFYSAGKPSM